MATQPALLLGPHHKRSRRPGAAPRPGLLRRGPRELDLAEQKQDADGGGSDGVEYAAADSRLWAYAVMEACGGRAGVGEGAGVWEESQVSQGVGYEELGGISVCLKRTSGLVLFNRKKFFFIFLGGV